MGITIHLGWWLIPLALTVIFWVRAWWETPTNRGNTGYYNFPDLSGIFTYGVALIATLTVWLVCFAVLPALKSGGA